MEMGIWTPLPHTIRAEPRMEMIVETIQRRHEGAGKDSGLDFAAELLQEAERLGFTRTLIAERWLGPDLEAWMLASALAMRTSRIELIVAVHPGILSPQITAKMAATLDRLSGGRAAVNIVNGWWQEEFELFSAHGWLDRSDDRYVRTDEFMAVLRQLWAGDESDFDGRFYKLKRPRLPSTVLTRPHPPIYTASLSPQGKESIARLGDRWFVTPRTAGLTHREFDQVATEIGEEIDKLREAALQHGRPIGFGVAGHVICAPTMEEADRQAEDLEAYGKSAMMHIVVSRSTFTGFVGTPELIAERLARYEAMGVSFSMLHFHPMIEGMRNFAAEVMPLLGAAPTA
jgi:FMNH2-dependent dimethyl sulfone monooxygenase